MTFDEYKNLTDSQRERLQKAFTKSTWSSIWAGLKFSIGLFLANIFAMAVMIVFLKETDVETMQGFQFIATIINFGFMLNYFIKQLKKVRDVFNESVKEILKKEE